jgi:HK97 family phage prohead protease
MTTREAPTLAPEVRQYATLFELREAQAVGKGNAYTYLEGRAVPYDVWGELAWFLELHEQDSFKRSTAGGAGQRLPLLLFHDNRSFPIGHAEKWTHDDGLTGVWRLNDSPEAQRGAKAADAGDLLGLSVGFMPIRSKWDYVDDWAPDLGAEHKDKVTRQESRLLEVSLTPTPVFVAAEVTSVRTAYDVQKRQREAAEARGTTADAWRRLVDGLRLPASD